MHFYYGSGTDAIDSCIQPVRKKSKQATKQHLSGLLIGQMYSQWILLAKTYISKQNELIKALIILEKKANLSHFKLNMHEMPTTIFQIAEPLQNLTMFLNCAN